MKKIIEFVLKVIASRVLKRQTPQIIVITGTIGKTSTKEAIYQMLRGSLRVRSTVKNYNNELGVPLTILGEESPGKSIFGWLRVFLNGFYQAFLKLKEYPEWLVLEVASDKPGDLAYIMSIIPQKLLKMCFLTAITPVHMEFYNSLDELAREKLTPFLYMSGSSLGVFNADMVDKKWLTHSNLESKKLLGYSLNKGKASIAVRVKEMTFSEEGIQGVICSLKRQYRFLLKGGVASYQVYPLLAAVVAGESLKLPYEEIVNGLKRYKILPGRMHLIKGMRNSVIIDDTYNSSPEAAKKAVEALKKYPLDGRKIAVLGDMLELGEDSKRFHNELGDKVVDEKIDVLVGYGNMAQYICQTAKRKGMKNVFHFSRQEELIDFLKKIIKENDIILIKGSQGMRMEKVTQSLMENPQEARFLLVRQDKQWQKL